MKNWMKTFLRSLICLGLMLPSATSCYDDSAIWDKFENLENKINSLEVELNEQVAALNALLSDITTISTCKKNDDGSYTVTLTNGTKFNVLPEGTDFSSLVTYKVIDGKNYWATYDATGAAVVLTDASGKPIPVSTEISVTLKDGVYYLVINGKEYVTGYDAEDVVQVFSSCTPLKDASGNVYAVKFTLGEGMTTTVALDGYSGVLFKVSNINNQILSDYYVGYGKTQSLYMEMPGVVDYVMQVPDGWRVKEVTEELTGETYVEITAPSEETVELGAAVADGDLKVVSVVEGGKAAISKIYLSTDPFKTYNVSPLKAVIEPLTGIQKFAYGMMLSGEFDEAAVTARVNELLGASGELPAGYHISEIPLDNTLAEIYGEELTTDLSYVFWALPVLYREEADGVEAGFYAVEEMMRTLSLNPISVKVDVTDVTMLDAKVAVEVKGAQSVYAGVAEKTDKVMEEILYLINNGIVEPVASAVSYSGPASEFPTKESGIYMNPDTKYVAWVVAVEGGKKEYAVSDIVYKEFATNAIKAGGTSVLTVGDFSVTPSSIAAPLQSEGAAMIFYAFFSDEDGAFYQTASNEAKMEMIMKAEDCVSVRGASTEAVLKYIQPETTKWLYAVAVGKDGLYGDVVCKSATTGNVSFNSLSLKVDEVAIKSDEATLKVTVSGGTATDYIYWVGYEKDPFWLGLNKSRTTAEKYMAANPDAEQIVSVMKHNGAVAEDGTVTLSDLSMSTTYIFLVLAKDESGNYSKAGYKKFTTLAADLGDVVVTDSEKWTAAKQFIESNIDWDENYFSMSAGNGQGFASYAFSIKIPTDLTAYISCFTPGVNITTKEEMMVQIENLCTASTSNSIVTKDENGNDVMLPDWTDDNGRLIQGSMFNYYQMYPHGSAKDGMFTYFSSKGHVDCTASDEGTCSAYDMYLETIASYMSLDHWKAYLIDFGNYNHDGDPNSPYSRRLEDPAKIEAIAQQYVDLYTKYYKDAKPILYVNNGDAVRVVNRTASGLNDNGEVIDEVIVVLKDDLGNYYEPIYIEVPNYYN